MRLSKSAASVFAFWATLAAIVSALNLVVANKHFQNYASWTGNLVLEKKLELLKEFARHGPVDAVLLGSSTTDCGISAEVLSIDLSTYLRRPYRVFNFGIGATEGSTYPKLYRLIRTVAAPKTIFLVGRIEAIRKDEFDGQGMDRALNRAPIGTAVNSDIGVALSSWFWSIPIIHDRSAIADWLICGEPCHRPADYATDFHYISEFGDTHYRHFADNSDTYWADYRTHYYTNDILGAIKPGATIIDYFGKADMDGMSLLRSLAKRDNVRIRALYIDHPALLMAGVTDEYKSKRRQFNFQFADFFGDKLDYFLDEYRINDFEILDEVHMNSAGAHRYSTWLARMLAGRPLPRSDVWEGPRTVGLYDDYRHGRRKKNIRDLNYWSDVILRDTADEGDVLKVSFVENSYTTAFVPRTDSPVSLALLLSDGHDAEARAIPVGPGEFLAQFNALPLKDHEAFIVRAFSNATGADGTVFGAPLKTYSWTRLASLATDLRHKLAVAGQ